MWSHREPAGAVLALLCALTVAPSSAPHTHREKRSLIKRKRFSSKPLMTKCKIHIFLSPHVDPSETTVILACQWCPTSDRFPQAATLVCQGLSGFLVSCKHPRTGQALCRIHHVLLLSIVMIQSTGPSGGQGSWEEDPVALKIKVVTNPQLQGSSIWPQTWALTTKPSCLSHFHA